MKVKVRKVLPAIHFAAAQRNHFLLNVLIPHTLVLILPFFFADVLACWQGVALALAMWILVGGLGISVGYYAMMFLCHLAMRPNYLRIV